MKQLSAAESSIEALNSQLAELETSETLSRARQQHEAVVGGLQQRHEHQVLLLNEKLDGLTGQIRDKVGLIFFI